MRGLTIGRLAEANGVNLETVRYYERIGLMPEPERTSGGHRLYGAAEARRLAFIRRARELGFPLENIRALLALNDAEDISCAQVRDIAGIHLDDVDRKIEDLKRLRRILAKAVDACPGEGGDGCPVLDLLND